MKTTLKGFAMFSLIFSIVILTSCNALSPDDSVFHGGIILNDEMMSEIKAEIFTTNSDVSSESDVVETNVITSGTDTEKNDSEETEKNVFEDTEEKEQNGTVGSDSDSSGSEHCESGTNNSDKKFVYWTKGGEVWHLYRECGYLKKSSNVMEGSIDEALEKGKTKVCGTCDRKANK